MSCTLLINPSGTEGAVVNYVSFTADSPVTFFCSRDKKAALLQFTGVQQLFWNLWKFAYGRGLIIHTGVCFIFFISDFSTLLFSGDESKVFRINLLTLFPLCF